MSLAQEPKSPERSSGVGKSRPVSPLLVFLLLFVMYNANLRCVRFDDTVPGRVLPFCVLLDHTLYLDHWVEPLIARSDKIGGTYYLSRSRGHWMSAYPIIMPLVITPLYVIPAWLVARRNPPLAPGDMVLSTLVNWMEKLSASLIAALSALVLYLALQKITSANLSLIATLVYALAGSPWSVSSQGLWRHGFTQLCFAALLWGLFQNARSGGSAFWPGLALAAAAANNSADGIVALPFLIYFARQGGRQFARFFTPLATLGCLVLAYNLYFFGRLWGGYPSFVVQTPEGLRLFKAAPSWQAAGGLLFSPSRGLMMFMPWTVFALWGMFRSWKQNTLPGGRYLIAGIAGVFIAHSVLGTWWGGWCFGPRYMGDLLPFLALFLIPVWPQIQAGQLLRAAAIAAVALSVWVQIVGAFYYPRGNWDGYPANVDLHPSRLWNWRDTQILRTWKAGPARPDLFYGLFLLNDFIKPDRTILPHGGQTQEIRGRSPE